MIYDKILYEDQMSLNTDRFDGRFQLCILKATKLTAIEYLPDLNPGKIKFLVRKVTIGMA